MKRSWQLTSLAASVCLCLGWLVLLAAGQKQQEAEAQQAKADIDPQAQQVVDALAQTLAGADNFATKLEAAINISDGENKMRIEREIRILAQRPNRLRLSFKTAGGPASEEMQLVSDGEKLTTFLANSNQYVVQETVKSLEGLLEHPILRRVTVDATNGGAILGAIFSENPTDWLLSDVNTVEYLGKVKLDETECHHLQFKQAQLDWQLWVATGPQPVIRQFKPDTDKLVEQLAKQQPQLKDLKFDVVMKCSQWKLDAELKGDTFSFKPPEDAEEVESLSPGRREMPDPRELVGKEAPPFELDLLGGNTVKLSQHKNKDVVILDFWATWCGPCRQAMPIIAKVADAYSRKDVVLYAVNVEETPAAVNEFLEQSELDLTVLLDKKGEVAKAYRAFGIPQTVIIGKDGTVQVVHVGLSPNLEAELNEELGALVAGKNLAGNKKDEGEKQGSEEEGDK